MKKFWKRSFGFGMGILSSLGLFPGFHHDSKPLAPTFEPEDTQNNQMLYLEHAKSMFSDDFTGMTAHRSHSSHRSHRSHRSHSSHRSHYSSSSSKATSSYTYRSTEGGYRRNKNPVAQDQTVKTMEDAPKTIYLRARDKDKDPLTYKIIDSPKHGKILKDGKKITYIPHLEFSGADTFTFKANDGLADSNLATIRVIVTGENDAPITSNQNIQLLKNTSAVIHLFGYDAEDEQLTFKIQKAPSKGVLTGTNGQLTYTPYPDTTGKDFFTFIARDGNHSSRAAMVTIGIRDSNSPPRALSSQHAVMLNGQEQIELKAIDEDGDPLTYSIQSLPQHGTLSGEIGAGAITYKPKPGYTGIDGFQFIANDGISASNTGQIVIIVTGVEIHED